MVKRHSKAAKVNKNVKKPTTRANEVEVVKKQKRLHFGVMATFRFIFANWKLFLPLLLLAVAICGLTSGVSDDAMALMMVMAFLMLWLTALFFARKVMSGKKVKFRDGLYSAMAPLWSTLSVFVVLAIQCIPILLVVIGQAAAVETDLFGDMFYGSLFVLFTMAMVAISGYLLSGTFMGLIAVSAPGMYPMRALRLTHELMIGKRVQFVLRMFIMVIVLITIGLMVVGPAVLVDLALQNWAGIVWPMLVPIFAVTAACVAIIYTTIYLYMYYRELLEYD